MSSAVVVSAVAFTPITNSRRCINAFLIMMICLFPVPDGLLANDMSASATKPEKPLSGNGGVVDPTPLGLRIGVTTLVEGRNWRQERKLFVNEDRGMTARDYQSWMPTDFEVDGVHLVDVRDTGIPNLDDGKLFFIDEKLAMLRLEGSFRDDEDQNILAGLTQKYGKPKKIDFSNYQWKSNDLLILLNINGMYGDVRLEYSSVKLVKTLDGRMKSAQAKHEKEALRGQSKDL